MTQEEFEVLAGIIATADNGCVQCTHDLAYQCQKKWPEFPWIERVKEKR